MNSVHNLLTCQGFETCAINGGRWFDRHKANSLPLRRTTLTDHQNIQQTYDRFSPLYDLIFKPYLTSGRERAVEILAPHRDSRVLEIGVGTGLSLEYYPQNVEVIGFDYSHGMLREARRKANESSHCRVDLMQMDAQNLAFSSGSFDCIMAAYVLTVVPEPERAVRELFRVARPGARVVLINYLRSRNKLISIIEDFLHPFFSKIGLFTLDHNLPHLLEKYGAENIKIEPTSFLKTHHIISFNVPA